MRAPPEVPYLFAMESAMDELAYKLAIDPLELRRRNDTMVETVTGKPYTSRSLVQCIDHGAELFGWSRRNPQPRSMATLDELVGWGYATAFYPTQMGPAECTLTLSPDVTVKLEIGTHEIGTGIRTVLAQTTADLLGLPLGAVEVVVGDSMLPAAPLTAGSNSTATCCTVIGLACENLRHRLARAAVQGKSPFAGKPNESLKLKAGTLTDGLLAEPIAVSIRRLGRSRPIVQKASHAPHGLPPVFGNMLVRKGKPVIMGGSNMKDRMQFAHGAQFVEVRIARHSGEVRVSRMVGVFAAGRIMNRRTAWAQLNGGQIWGVSSALHEATELDRTSARFVNQNLAEYHVPVCADTPAMETVMLDEVDTLVNPLGIKGVGELGVTGVNAAIANAVFHATGVRLRKLPIRPRRPQPRSASQLRPEPHLQDVPAQVLVFDDARNLLAHILRVHDDHFLGRPVFFFALDHRQRRGRARHPVAQRGRHGNLAHDPHLRRLAARALHQVRRLEADFVEHPFHDGVQPPRTDVFGRLVDLKGELGHFAQGFRRKLEPQAFGFEQRRRLLHQRGLGLGQDADEVAHGQRLQLDPNGEAALQLRDQVARLRHMERAGRDEQDVVGRKPCRISCSRSCLRRWAGCRAGPPSRLTSGPWPPSRPAILSISSRNTMP